MQGVHQESPFSILLSIIVADILANLIDADKKINEIQIGDHEIKILNFVDNNSIFSRDIIRLNRIKVILKLHEDVYSSKENFLKS